MLPLQFLKFWFYQAPHELLAIFLSLNNAFLQLFSLPLLVKTYFKPWKNEYRKGLVGFSRGMGMFIKTFVIAADTVMFLAILYIEFLLFIAFLFWPFATFFFVDTPVLFYSSLLFIFTIFLTFRPQKPEDYSKTRRPSAEIIRDLLKRNDVQFVLSKAEISIKDVPLIEVQKDSVLKNISGPVSALDFFAYYLISIEDTAKLLFQKHLKKEDLMNILNWAKTAFPPESAKKPFRVSFWGEGIGEAWVSGWTLETSKYVLDITSQAISSKPLIIGRSEEYKEVVEALQADKSCLLVGEPGSGRSTLVEAIAYDSFVGVLKGNLRHQRFYQLLADALLAGAQNQGQLEERLENIIAEVSHSGNIILYVPNFENLMGSSTFSTDLSGALIPYMEKGIIRLVATITPASYKKYIEPKHTLSSAINIVRFEEPSVDTAFQMLLAKTLEIENKSKISVTYSAVLSAWKFADKYLQDRVMPGAGVVLLEDTIAMVLVNGDRIVRGEDVISKIESKTKIAVGMPGEKEKELLLHLEEELHRRIVGQKEAVFEISEALRRIRAGLGNTKKPISFLFLGPTGVGKTATAKALSEIYYSGEENMIRFDMSEYSTEESVKRLLGGVQDASGLTDKVHDRPFSLVLLDEFEKSNSKIVDLFLQVFDDGRLTDNAGKTVSFADTIIIATSNAASEYIREEVNKGTTLDKNFQGKLMEFLQEKGIFRPELLNRFDGIVVFKPLEKEEINQIVRLMLEDLSKKMLGEDIAINFDNKVIDKIVNEGFDQEFGARPLRRFIQDNIEDMIAQKMLKDEIKRGDEVSLTLDVNNNLQLV